jgi:hypothetical protein
LNFAAIGRRQRPPIWLRSSRKATRPAESRRETQARMLLQTPG